MSYVSLLRAVSQVLQLLRQPEKLDVELRPEIVFRICINALQCFGQKLCENHLMRLPPWLV